MFQHVEQEHDVNGRPHGRRQIFGGRAAEDAAGEVAVDADVTGIAAEGVVAATAECAHVLAGTAANVEHGTRRPEPHEFRLNDRQPRLVPEVPVIVRRKRPGVIRRPVGAVGSRDMLWGTHERRSSRIPTDVTTGPVLVTGGAGFLGAALVRRLVTERYDVHVIVRPTTGLARIANLLDLVRLHRADLAEADEVAAVIGPLEPVTVFHTAATGAYAKVGETGLFRDNVLSIFNLLQATAPLAGCRVIHTASSLEPGPRVLAVRESDPAAPAVPYAASKAAATLLALQAGACGRRVVALRPFAVYGPGEPDQRLIPTAIRAAITGTPLRLTEARFTRDLVFVDDVADAYLAASRVDGIDGELINIATGRPTANEEIVRTIERLTGRAIAIADERYPARATDRPFWCADVTKAERLLGWRATHTVDEGLARTIDTYVDTHADR